MTGLAPLGATPDPARLERRIGQMPGGRYIRPHYTAGPFWLVLLGDSRLHSHTIRLCVEAYPAYAHVPYVDDAGDSHAASVHVMPDFVKALLFWEDDDNGVLTDLAAGPFEQLESSADIEAAIATHMPTLMRYSINSDGTFADLCRRAVRAPAVGLSGLLALMRNLPDDVRLEEGQATVALAGVLA